MISKATKYISIFFVLSVIYLAPEVGNVQNRFAIAEEPLSSLGHVDFPISCGPAVQTRFHRGLALLHHMMYKQAEREFEEAAEIDTKCAMAYWGIAMTLFHPLWPGKPTRDDLKKGWEAVQTAKALHPPSGREQAYINAVGAFYKDWENVDHKTRLASWEAAQKRIYETYPDDSEAVAFYALARLATAPKSDKTFAHQREAGKILEALHAREPEHPGGFHYLIHAYDNPSLARLALNAARGYDKIAPEVPHALHMPSHIFTRLGLWNDSIRWNQRSADAALRQPVNGAISMHYAHAIDYLMYAYLQKAQDEKAKELLQRIKTTENFQDSFATAYGIAAAQVRYPLERKKWGEAAVLPLPVPRSFPWQKYPEIESIVYFARGLGAARINHTGTAWREVEKLNAIYDQLINTEHNYWAVLVDAQRKTITAWITFSEGNETKALMLMREAANLEDSVDKHPVTPGAVLPARELLGDMLVLTNRPEAALEAYEISLGISPNRFNSLYGAGRAAELAGDMIKAEFYYSSLLENSDQVDTERDGMKLAKEFLFAD
jgi:tetratricopeptide (TPR) repeat protein